MKLLRNVGLALVTLVAMGSDAWAVPSLQLYIEGATYDEASESWVLVADGPFTLWVVGNTNIYDVKLSAAVSTVEASDGGSVTVTSTTSGLMCGSGACDVSGDPAAPVFNGLSADGAIPVMGDGSELPSQGIYGPGVSFFEWYLGDFTSTLDPVGDLSLVFPTTFPDQGQINAYTIAVSGLTSVHFDAYDHIVRNDDIHAKFAPFSHDATAVAEPNGLLLLGAALGGAALWRRQLANRR